MVLQSTQALRGLRVYKELQAKHKLGKISVPLCSPDARYVVGYIIKRPDIAFMFKRPEEFIALDAMHNNHGVIVPTKDKASFGKEAIKRLKLDWDRCMLLHAMDVRSQSGEKLGFVSSLVYEAVTGKIVALIPDEGAISSFLLGVSEISADLLLGYKDGAFWVKEEALSIKPSGGAAAHAGKAIAHASKHVAKGQEKSKQALSKLNDEASVQLGRQIKKTRSMFSSFKEEYKKASKD